MGIFSLTGKRSINLEYIIFNWFGIFLWFCTWIEQLKCMYFALHYRYKTSATVTGKSILPVLNCSIGIKKGEVHKNKPRRDKIASERKSGIHSGSSFLYRVLCADSCTSSPDWVAGCHRSIWQSQRCQQGMWWCSGLQKHFEAAPVKQTRRTTVKSIWGLFGRPRNLLK